jgi:hypothetical protein
MFKHERGNWTHYRQLQPKPMEVDFHFSDYGAREVPYWDAMSAIRSTAYAALERAYNEGIKYVLFTHELSTSRQGKTTARSQVRNLMRSSDATPYIHRSQCIQHESVFPFLVS